MGQRFLKPWAGVVLLLPLLGDANIAEKTPGEAEPAIHGDRQEEEGSPLSADEPLPRWLSTITENIACEHGISARLVKSIILTESQGDPRKVSPRGAKGLMQLMPVVMQHYKVADPYDPAANIRAGVQYFCNLLEEFSGDLPLALAAYNAGPTAVRKYRGIPPFAETQAFVKKVSLLFEAAETHPPFPFLTAKGGGREAGENQEISPMAGGMISREKSRFLASLFRLGERDMEEVQVQ